MSIEDLKIGIFRLVSIAEENCDEKWFREMDAVGVELTNALDELEQYRKTGLTSQMVKDLIKSEKAAHKVALENAHALDEAEQYKLALFAVLRAHSMEVAMEQGLSTDGHSMLAVKIMKSVLEKCNYETLKVLYDEALAKMGGK